MPTFTRLKSGSWRVQVRRKGRYVNNTFLRHRDAEEWALETERRIDRGEPTLGLREARTFGDLVRLISRKWASASAGPRPRASRFLERRLGRLRLSELDRQCLIQFGKERAREGAGPVTLGIDLGYIKTILSHAAAVHGIVVSTESISLAQFALLRLGLVGKGDERDRRPTQNELDRLIAAFEGNPLQQIPLGRIIGFAVATAMRQDEICRVESSDFDRENKILVIRDRKDPRRKNGNDQRIPLLNVSGYDACGIVEEQRMFRFPTTDAYFHTTEDLSVQLFGDNAASSR